MRDQIALGIGLFSARMPTRIGPGRRSVFSHAMQNRSKYVPAVEDAKHAVMRQARANPAIGRLAAAVVKNVISQLRGEVPADVTADDLDIPEFLHRTAKGS